MQSLVRYRKDRKPFVEILNQGYNLDEIEQLISPLKIFKRSNHIITEYDGSKICEKQVSNIYGIFDFSQFLKDGLPYIHDHFNAQYYSLHIERGVQQLKVFGDEIIINKDVYKKVFNVFSSSNGYYPLSISVGLFRQVCSNGMIVPVDQNSFNVKIKHCYRAVESQVEEFHKRLPLIDDTIKEQQTILECLSEEVISLKKMVENLVLKPNKEREHKKTLFDTVKKLGQKFIHSETDSFLVEEYSEEELAFLQNPTLLLEPSLFQQKDLELNKYKLYNCYMELFRNRNTAVIEKENKRILEALEVQKN